MGTVAVVLSTTIVNVAIPAIMADFGMDQVRAQWLATGMLAAMTTTILASARVVERLGQRRTFAGAMLAFVAVSLLAAASWNGTVMIVARVLQGAVAGVIQPLALVVIFQVFPDRERGRALGYYGMGVVLAPALGPTLGGVLVDAFSWRAVYLAPVPICLLGFLGALRYLDNRRAAQIQRFDWWGLASLAAGLLLLLAGLAALVAQVAGWRAPVLLAGGAVALVAFVLRQRHARAPLVHLQVLRRPEFALAALLAAVYGAGLYATTYLLPLLVQGVQGFSATLTGLVMMPAGLVLAAIFPLSGRAADRYPAHRQILAGLLLFALALFALAATGPATGFLALALIILVGRVGLGFALPAVSVNALRALPETLVQQGSGVINFGRLLGGAFGVNLFALLLEWRVAAHVPPGLDFDLHRFYAEAEAAAAVAPGALAALTRAFGETFIALGVLFLVALLPAAAMGVYGGRRRAGRNAGV